MHVGLFDPSHGNFVIHGGESQEDGTLLSDCWFLDSNPTWNECTVSSSAAAPLPRRGHSAVFYKDVIFIFGGCAPTPCTLQAHPHTLFWSQEIRPQTCCQRDGEETRTFTVSVCSAKRAWQNAAIEILDSRADCDGMPVLLIGLPVRQGL